VPRPGRRQGDPRTRDTIVEAARAEFLERGYTATTIRSVARRAEVDPALVYHYFTDKATLYGSTLSLPADPRQILDDVRTEPASPGVRLVEGFLAQWEAGPGQPGQSFVNQVQAMSSSPEAAPDERPATGSGRSSPARRRPSSRPRTRSPSSAAAFLVKVSPSTRSGRTIPFATSQTSRAAMVSLLPEPAPAITAIGPGGAPITAACSAVGSAMPSRRASWTGLY